MVTVKITETYDMKTTVGKLGVIGIHTPKLNQIANMYPGMLINYKFARFKKCDVVGACASVLPADPLQVGVSAGSIAPEDMFNPILMSATTNEGFDTIMNMIYNGTQASYAGSVTLSETSINADRAMDVYYALLAQNNKWRKAMPQSGFKLRNLVPLAHQLLSNYGDSKQIETIYNAQTGITHSPNQGIVTATEDDLDPVPKALGLTFRGRAVRMPRFPLHIAQSNGSVNPNNYPDMQTFVACLVLPPAKLHEFYYRMRVTWTISFEKLIATTDYGTEATIVQNGVISHDANYQYAQSKTKLENSTSSVDTDGVDIKKIMESA